MTRLRGMRGRVWSHMPVRLAARGLLAAVILAAAAAVPPARADHAGAPLLPAPYMGTDIPQLSRKLMVGSAITVCAADYPEATKAAVKAWKNALGFDVFSLLGAPCSAATSDVHIAQVATSTPTTADPDSGLMCGKIADAKACAQPFVIFAPQPVTYASITTVMISVASHHHPIDVTPDVTTGPCASPRDGSPTGMSRSRCSTGPPPGGAIDSCRQGAT